MPTYEYRCRDCGALTERTERISDHEKIAQDDRGAPRCPQCKSAQVEPVFSTFFAKTAKKS